MMPPKKNYSYTNLADTPQHGEIIESSYLLAEKGPKSIWTKVLEMVVLVATIGGCAYLVVFLFHHGNHHDSATAKDSASHPHPPVGASSSTSQDPTSCNSNSKCAELGLNGFCCPTAEGDYLACCFEN
ncbi:unnamed protein product [Ectocarpus sp. 4 AP-2014]